MKWSSMCFEINRIQDKAQHELDCAKAFNEKFPNKYPEETYEQIYKRVHREEIARYVNISLIEFFRLIDIDKFPITMTISRKIDLWDETITIDIPDEYLEKEE